MTPDGFHAKLQTYHRDHRGIAQLDLPLNNFFAAIALKVVVSYRPDRIRLVLDR